MNNKSLARRVVHGVVKTSALGAPLGPHLTRYSMYDHIRSVVDKEAGASTASFKVLAISGSASFAREIGLAAADIRCADYPEYNILDLPFTDGEFDVVVSDQVLEHVEGDPFQAVSETARVVRDGGLIIHTTCFFNWIHPDPDDFWRFTPSALALLCDDTVEPVDVGGWGNLAILPLTRLGLRNAPVPGSRWHPLHWAATRNNPRWPVCTWLIARKFSGCG
jgi:SAM-dependent methyltransferase